MLDLPKIVGILALFTWINYLAHPRCSDQQIPPAAGAKLAKSPMNSKTNTIFDSHQDQPNLVDLEDHVYQVRQQSLVANRLASQSAQSRWDGKFATGFGATGNEKSAKNFMGNVGVSRQEASNLINRHPQILDCPSSLQPGVWVGPTGARRYICGLQQLDAGQPVFSFGSNGDFRFEDSIRKMKPDIPVVIFDPTMGGNQPIRAGGDKEKALNYAKGQGYRFVTTGIAYKQGTLRQETVQKQALFEASVDSLESLMLKANHSHMGILKIDASGEFEIFAKLQANNFPLGQKVGILTLEIHMFHPQEDGGTVNCCYGPKDLSNLLNYISEEGFIIVGDELTPEKCCAEYSFVNPNYFGFFKK